MWGALSFSRLPPDGPQTARSCFGRSTLAARGVTLLPQISSDTRWWNILAPSSSSDTSHGWALLSYPSSAGIDGWSFDLSVTSDGGSTWTTRPVSSEVSGPKRNVWRWRDLVFWIPRMAGCESRTKQVVRHFVLENCSSGDVRMVGARGSQSKVTQRYRVQSFRCPAEMAFSSRTTAMPYTQLGMGEILFRRFPYRPRPRSRRKVPPL